MGMVLCYKNDMVMKAIMMMIFTILVPVVQMMDSAVHRINHSPADKH